jgi:p38 MAP kinase
LTIFNTSFFVLGILTFIAIDLVENMLNIDPHGRITTADAIKHPYVVTYQDSDDEPVCNSRLDWSLLDSELSADEWKSTMYVP